MVQTLKIKVKKLKHNTPIKIKVQIMKNSVKDDIKKKPVCLQNCYM